MGCTGSARGVSVDGDTIDWRVVNYPNVHQLPAVVLATVLGHRSGSATYWLTDKDFNEAVRLLEPAGACEAFDHPNLWAWHALQSEFAQLSHPRTTSVVAVFLDEKLTATDDRQRRLSGRICPRDDWPRPMITPRCRSERSPTVPQ